MPTNKYAEYYNETVAVCAKCELKGFLPARGGYAACECYVRYMQLRALHDSGLPKLYWDIRAEDFTGDKAAFAVVQDYIDNFRSIVRTGSGLYLYGNPGVGKTLLASYILRAGLAQGFKCNFYYFNNVLSVFTEAWRDERARDEVESNIINSDLLVIDDMGREYHSNKKLHESILDTVIRTRASNLKPIVVTSNLDRYDVKDNYGSVIIDLFKGHLKSVNVTGESHRGQDGPASA